MVSLEKGLIMMGISNGSKFHPLPFQFFNQISRIIFNVKY